MSHAQSKTQMQPDTMLSRRPDGSWKASRRFLVKRTLRAPCQPEAGTRVEIGTGYGWTAADAVEEMNTQIAIRTK